MEHLHYIKLHIKRNVLNFMERYIFQINFMLFNGHGEFYFEKYFC